VKQDEEIREEELGGKAVWEDSAEKREASLKERKAKMILAARQYVSSSPAASLFFFSSLSHFFGHDEEAIWNFLLFRFILSYSFAHSISLTDDYWPSRRRRRKLLRVGRHHNVNLCL
jgi:hypothetical protein